MKIINATPKDKEELLSLYHAMIGGPCEWSENYPDENTIAFDLKNEDLFVMKNDKEEIVATISIDHDDAVEALTCWRADLAPSGELSRLCVRKDMQGQGIAKTMMNYACDVLKSRGMKGFIYLSERGMWWHFRLMPRLDLKQLANVIF
ncbi:MAG: GNAT family N-acetyltransferase [Coprococcus sp.]